MAWFIVVEWLARLILVILIGLSVWSVAIIIERRKLIKSLESEDLENTIAKGIGDKDLSLLNSFISKGEGLKSQTLGICRDLQSSEQIDRAVSAFLNRKKKELEKGLPVLGTLGSTTPFIGLLGTILGIIVAFGALSSGKMDSQKIMYALAEALILTAVGLAVAIPAVIAFNNFNRRLNQILKECENLKDQYIAYLAGR